MERRPGVKAFSQTEALTFKITNDLSDSEYYSMRQHFPSYSFEGKNETG